MSKCVVCATETLDGARICDSCWDEAAKAMPKGANAGYVWQLGVEWGAKRARRFERVRCGATWLEADDE